ncbi:uncharacterized protein P884DRAFT_99210 [Thermothelomyces heterothallicus CBS 202.75]|uniref:uncharacterized protein n=1 Tax=Thermothelomyces heterothallicus CBS 202.75 TaxID=1149848 RepID=UPI0037433838
MRALFPDERRQNNVTRTHYITIQGSRLLVGIVKGQCEKGWDCTTSVHERTWRWEMYIRLLRQRYTRRRALRFPGASPGLTILLADWPTDGRLQEMPRGVPHKERAVPGAAYQ